MHGSVPQASPPQPQVSHSITSDGTPSVARSAATLWQPHSERGVDPVRSGRFAALTGCQGVRPTHERCFPAARAGCWAATNEYTFSTFSTLLAHVLTTRSHTITTPLLNGSPRRSAHGGASGGGTPGPGESRPSLLAFKRLSGLNGGCFRVLTAYSGTHCRRSGGPLRAWRRGDIVVSTGDS